MKTFKTIWSPSNGVPLVWIEWHFAGGTSIEDKKKEGLARHTAILWRRGTTEMSRHQLDVAVDKLGGSLSIYASRDSVSINGFCLSKHVETMADLMRHVATQPCFDVQEHEKLREESLQILGQISDQPQKLVQRYFSQYFWPGHPYARTKLGTKQSLAQLTTEDAVHFQQKVLASQSFLGIAGHAQPPQVESISKQFEEVSLAIQSRKTPKDKPPQSTQPLFPDSVTLTKKLHYVLRRNVQQTYVVIGFPAPTWGTLNAEALMIAETALGGPFSSKLIQEIRVKNGWAYSIGAYLSRTKHPYCFQIVFSCNGNATVPAITRTLQITDTMRTKGLTQAEVAFAKNHLVGSIGLAKETAYQRMAQSLHANLLGFPQDHYDTLADRVMKISPQKVNQTMQQTLDPHALCIVMVGNRPEDATTLCQQGIVTPSECTVHTEIL